MVGLRPRLALGLLPALASPTGALELSARLSVAPQWLGENRAALYHVGAPLVPTATGSRQDLELGLHEAGFNAQGSLRTQALQDWGSDRRGIANQVYYDGELGGGLGWSAGRKVLSWGVGFGFRPLDVVQREDRRSVNPPPLTGMPLLALEHFTATDAWTLAWTRPGAGAGGDDGRDPALAVHWYRLTGGDDLHGVARLSRRRGLEAGLGATRVVGEDWSFHGAALYQRRSRQRLNPLAGGGGPLATADPMTEAVWRHGLKAVAGGQWTDASGWSVLLEAWYDADAYSRRQWRRLDALTLSQRTLAGRVPAAAIDANVAWSSQAYQVANLLRENLLLRLAHDDGEGLHLHAELQATPADRGWVATVGVSHEGNRQRFAAGLRQLGGPDDSVAAQAPVRRMVWAEWRLGLR